MASNDDNNNVIPSSQPTDKRVPTGKGKKASGRGKTPAAENPSAEDETGGITRRLCEVDQVIDRRSDENMIEYLIRWKPDEKTHRQPRDTWVPSTECNCPLSIFEFEKAKGMHDNVYYEVDGIIDCFISHGKTEYLLKWKDLPLSESTWVRVEDMKCDELIEDFKANKKYGDRILEAVAEIIDMKIINEIEHFQIRKEGMRIHSENWYSVDKVYIMPNGRNELCKRYAKYC